MVIRVKVKTAAMAERCEKEVAYWYSIRPGAKFRVGINEMVATGITPHGTHILSAEGKWSPRDLGLHQEATSAIRLRGKEVRKELLKTKPNYDPLVRKRNRIPE